MYRTYKLLLLLLLTDLPAMATPIIVVRTNTGYTFATNAKNSGGEVHCKIRRSGDGIAIRSSNVVKGNVGPILYDFDEDLDKKLAGQRLGLDELESVIIASTVHSQQKLFSILTNRKILPRDADLTEFLTHFLIGATNAQGVFSVRGFLLPATPVGKPILRPVIVLDDLKVGEVFIWDGESPIRRPVAKDASGVLIAWRLLNLTYSLEARKFAAEHKTDHSFDQPWTIVTVNNAGQISFQFDGQNACHSLVTGTSR